MAVVVTNKCIYIVNGGFMISLECWLLKFKNGLLFVLVVFVADACIFVYVCMYRIAAHFYVWYVRAFLVCDWFIFSLSPFTNSLFLYNQFSQFINRLFYRKICDCVYHNHHKRIELNWTISISYRTWTWTGLMCLYIWIGSMLLLLLIMLWWWWWYIS